MTDETAIRDVLDRWVGAIRARDLDGVAAAHTDDIVLFDVPLPYDGVYGIDGYRATWPEFFEWIAGGAVLELVRLDVTAGDTVAYAHALFRTGMPEDIAAHPEKRLRSTFGLRKVDGAWVIAHEHHSMPHTA
jgi:uncharacterized protein (TIGR02246 family)